MDKKRIIEFIRNNIHLDENREVLKGINCYGFALGLDFDVRKLDYSWIFLKPGDIAKKLGEEPPVDYMVNINNFEDGLRLDMDTLGIQLYDACDSDESLCDLDIENYLSWLIAIYLAKDEKGYIKDIHFLRKLPSGIWAHKFGNNSQKVLYLPNLEECISVENNITYDQAGVYKLRLRR